MWLYYHMQREVAESPSDTIWQCLLLQSATLHKWDQIRKIECKYATLKQK